mmetsp:Transcript_83910/g.116620  ORF Transcript_83910/g.116620 Transcript_83910/m.116620 type:complete len:203 (+) Transcript_83910:1073-1681(+)
MQEIPDSVAKLRQHLAVEVAEVQPGDVVDEELLRVHKFGLQRRGHGEGAEVTRPAVLKELFRTVLAWSWQGGRHSLAAEAVEDGLTNLLGSARQVDPLALGGASSGEPWNPLAEAGIEDALQVDEHLPDGKAGCTCGVDPVGRHGQAEVGGPKEPYAVLEGMHGVQQVSALRAPHFVACNLKATAKPRKLSQGNAIAAAGAL